jgi:hypothetical protein
MPPHCAKCTHADLGQSIETIVGHYCFSEEFRLSFEDAAEGGRRDFVSEKQGRSGSENFSKSFK